MATSEALQDRLRRPLGFTLRVRVVRPADLSAKILPAVAGTGAFVSETRFCQVASDGLVYELTLFVTGDEQLAAARAAAETAGLQVLETIDLAMETHRGGACEMRGRTPIRSNNDLRIVYTPGVARVCKKIQADPELAREYTGIHNKVAIVTNGTAILGLGDIGCVPGMPVMEGKSAIFWEFVGISAEPILVDTKDPDEFIFVVEKIAPTFGAIQIEDVKAPECFPITRELDRRLAIPVMHDDQHGTATIVLAGLYSALKKTGRKIGDIRCAISGAGASGTAISELLQRAGIGDVILCDSKGIVCRGRKEGMNPEKVALAARTNRDNRSGTLADAMKGCELFIGCSQPNIVSQDMVRSMAKDPIVFALANPISEISRDDATEAGAAIYADGRLMNNALAYPGIFRGALDVRARDITLEMMMAAARKLADIVPAGELMPEMMDPATHRAVVEAVRQAAPKK